VAPGRGHIIYKQRSDLDGEAFGPGGRTRMLPRGWQPLAWSQAGSKLLVQHGLLLGLWSAAAPRGIIVLGQTSRHFTVLNGDWLAGRAPL
jgi:hypothetical protein